MLLEFGKAGKQMAAKPIVDYFQRVCYADLMHETQHFDDHRIGMTCITPEPLNPDW